LIGAIATFPAFQFSALCFAWLKSLLIEEWPFFGARIRLAIVFMVLFFIVGTDKNDVEIPGAA
jgi:hypothetical protein